MNKFSILLAFLLVVCSYEHSAARDVPFQVGEKLIYDVKIFGITVGQVTATVTEKVQVNGRETYHIVAVVRSTGAAARLYRLYDELHSYIDAETLELLKAERFLQEGRLRSYVAIDLNPETKSGTFYRETTGKHTIRNKFKILSPTLDAASVPYYVRGNHFDGAKTINLNVLYENQVKTVEAARLPDEVVDLRKVGRLKSQVFKQISGGDITLWISDDEKRLPVKIVALSIKVADWRIVDIVGYLSDAEN
jgi:hypothetical protein